MGINKNITSGKFTADNFKLAEYYSMSAATTHYILSNLDDGETFEYNQDNLHTDLLIALKEGMDNKIVKHIISLIKDINYGNGIEESDNPLCAYLYFYNNDTNNDILKLLISRGINLEEIYYIKPSSELSAILLAARLGRSDVVQILAESGANINFHGYENIDHVTSEPGLVECAQISGDEKTINVVRKLFAKKKEREEREKDRLDSINILEKKLSKNVKKNYMVEKLGNLLCSNEFIFDDNFSQDEFVKAIILDLKMAQSLEIFDLLELEGAYDVITDAIRDYENNKINQKNKNDNVKELEKGSNELEKKSANNDIMNSGREYENIKNLEKENKVLEDEIAAMKEKLDAFRKVFVE